MKKNIISLVLSSFLFVAGYDVKAAVENNVAENVKPATEVVDVKDAPVETIKNYPTEKWYEGVSFGGGVGLLGGVNLQLGYNSLGIKVFLKTD